jgi:endonuclease YncB( thermonuclease family)
MFHTINKALKLLIALLFLAGLVFLYQQRHWFEPVLVMADILRHRSDQRLPAHKEISGHVVSVESGDTFQVKTEAGPIYTTRLTGLLSPPYARFQTAEERELFQTSRNYLSDLILSNNVRVKLTYSSHNLSGLGIAHLNSTNVNIAILEAGMAELNRDYIKNLPALEQYALIRARQKAQTENRGIWREPPENSVVTSRKTAGTR